MNSFKDAGETARAIDSLVQSAKEKSEFCCGHQECHKHGCNAASAKTHYHPGGAAESALSSNTSEVGLLEQLWNRLDSLANTTEQNMEISQSIFKLVTPNNDDAPHPPHQHLSTMIHSQSGILMEQRRLIKEIDSISRSLNNNSNHNNNRPAPIETSSSPQASSSTTKPTASSINASYFYSSSATDTPVLKLTSIIETYQAIVTRYISKKRTDIIHGQALRLDSTQEIDDLNRQFDDLSRQMHYLSSLFTTSIMASSNTDLRVAGMVAPSPGPASSQVVGKEYKLSSSQYAVLIAKATQSEHLEIQFDNTHALLKDHANEINTLKEAIDAITSAAPHHTSTSASSRTGSVSSLVSASGGGVGGGPPSSEVRILQKQAEELRKVWSHELEANSILRSLIAKTQNDSINSTHEYAAREAGMKEEIDELVSALESNSREVSFYKSRITELEKRYQYDGQSATPASSTIHQSFRRSFSVEHSSDDVDQLKETIKKMDTERSRLISDFKIIKKKFDEKIIVWKSKYDDSTRLSDTLKRSSEEEERKFKSAISNFEILKSNWEVDRNRMEVEIKTLKAELDTTKQDRNRVLSSSNNSATLYNNDGALRLEYEKKISIMELRIKDLEGEIRVLLVERDSSNQKVTNMTQRFEVYEAQLKRERDRVKKYALKVEELRKRTADAGSATTPNFESSVRYYKV